MLKLVHDGSDSDANGVAALGSSLLDEIVRDGARQMLAAALQAEVAAQETTSMRSFQFHPRKRQ